MTSILLTFDILQAVNCLSSVLSDDVKSYLKQKLKSGTKEKVRFGENIEIKFSTKWEHPDLSYLHQLTPTVSYLETFSMAYDDQPPVKESASKVIVGLCTYSSQHFCLQTN